MKFSGIVKKGAGRGKDLGFATANLDVPKDLPDGLYIGLANSKPALVFIGAAQTFGETDRKAEIYILDFSDDLYNQKIEVETIKKLRENQKFESEQALIEQMKQDEQLAREFFKSYNSSN
ncbi:MAG: riboflavin kinase [Candidatus Doudnabacteria bacterium]